MLSSTLYAKAKMPHSMLISQNHSNISRRTLRLCSIPPLMVTGILHWADLYSAGIDECAMVVLHGVFCIGMVGEPHERELA